MKSKLTRTLFATAFVAAASVSAMAADNGNAYAYDIRVNSADPAKPVVTYKLNAPASSVQVKALVNGAEVATVNGGTSQGVDNSVSFDLTTQQGTVTFKVVANMAAAQSAWSVVEMGNINLGGNGASIAVNRNPESPTFGQIIVSETTGDSKGLHVYNPNFTDTGRKGITGGVSATDDNAAAGLFQRIRFSEDGRLFGLSNNYGTQGLYEFDVTSLNASPVFQGTPDATTGKITNNGTFVGGCGAGLDVWGSGSNLKIATVTSRTHAASMYVQKVSIYNLGTAKTWSGAPNATSDDSYNNTNMLLCAFMRPAYSNIAFDKDGQGVGVLGYAGGPSATDKSYVHADCASLTKNYEQGEGYDQITDWKYKWPFGSAMAYNSDRSVLAIVSGNTIHFYNVTVSNGGTPSFERKAGYALAANLGNISDGNIHIDDIAFDYAGNIYIVANPVGGTPKVFAVRGPFMPTAITTPAPSNTAYVKSNQTIVSGNDDVNIRLTEAKSYAGRNMVSLRWIGDLNSEKGLPVTQTKGPVYYDIYRDNQPIVKQYKASSYVDVDLTDGKHDYFIRAYAYSTDGTTLGYKDSNVISPNIKRDPAMTVYYLENVYNYPIASDAEKNQYAAGSDKIVNTTGLIGNMNLGQGSAGARGDMYRQGVFKVLNGKPTWFVSQITDRDADMTTPDGVPAINAYGAIQSGEKGGVLTFNAEDPRQAPTRILEYSPMVNQSLVVFDGWSNKPLISNVNILGTGFASMLFRANDNLNDVPTQNASVAGSGRYLDPIHMLGFASYGVANGTCSNVTGKPFPDGIDFFELSRNESHNPNEVKTGNQYYRTQYLNSNGHAGNGRVFVPLNSSRDLYVFNYNGNLTDAKVYTAPSAKASTENYAIPIEGREDFLHVMRSDNVYYVNAQTGQYTPLNLSESEKRSACGATFLFNNEIFYIHPTSDRSNNPGHFRIDMPTRTWDAAQRRFVTDYTQADFQNMVPQAAYVQDDFEEALMGTAGNSNGAFFGFYDTEEVTPEGIKYPVKYIYQYIPGVRFAKYKFYPKNEFPPIQPNLDIVLINKDSNDDKNSKHGHDSDKAEEMSHYTVQYGWYPRPFEQEEGTNYVTHHYYYEVKDSHGNVVASGTIPYEPGKPYYEMPEYAPEFGADGKGVARNEEYTIIVTPYYINTSDPTDIRAGGPGVDKDVITYTPDVKPITATPYEHDNADGKHPDQYRVDIDFDRAPRNTEEAEPGDNIVPEEVSYFIIEYKEPGGEWTPIPDFVLHIGDQDYDCPDGHIPGDYDFKNDKGQLPGADPNNEPDCVGYYYPDHKPEPGTEYRVIAVYADENPVIYDTAEQSTPLGEWGTTGVENITVASTNNNVTVFPNPAVDFVTVMAGDIMGTVKIVNINGATIKTIAANANSINLYVGDLAAGVYFVTVDNGSPVRVIKK